MKIITLLMLSILSMSCSSSGDADVINKLEEACKTGKGTLSITVTLSYWGNTVSMMCSNIK